MTRQEIEQKIAVYQQAAQSYSEQAQRAIGAILALEDLLSTMPDEVPVVSKEE